MNNLFSAGHFTFGGKSYWVSWASSENTLRNARWNWFTGRNYCRKVPNNSIILLMSITFKYLNENININT